MKWRVWVGERQPRARQHSHPFATSGIDEIDCGGCITELRFMRGGATRGCSRGEGEEQRGWRAPLTLPRPSSATPQAPLSAAKTQKGEKTLLLAVTLARLPTSYPRTSRDPGRYHPCRRSSPCHARVTQPPGMNGRIERMYESRGETKEDA